MGQALPYDTADALRASLRGADGESTVFSGLGFAPGLRGVSALQTVSSKTGGAIKADAFKAILEDFYLTNPIARASRTMAECSALSTALDTPVAAE